MPINWSQTTIAGPRKNGNPTNSARNIPPVSSMLTSMCIRLGAISDKQRRVSQRKTRSFSVLKNKYEISFNFFVFVSHQRSTKIFTSTLFLNVLRSFFFFSFSNGLLVVMKRLQMFILQLFPVVFFFLQNPVGLF